MTKEKKDDLNEQQTFLNDQEESLESINNKKDTPDEQAATVEEVPVSETDTGETPLADEPPAPESSEPIEDPIVEEEDAVITEPEPTPEPEPEAEVEDEPAE
jgi:hypothetical protein